MTPMKTEITRASEGDMDGILALQAANQAVYELACAREGEGQVGTTLVALVARGAELHWVGVGDSRLYHYRAGDDTLTQCTDDHTYANQLLRQVAAGTLSPEAAAADPDRLALASFLGLAQIPAIDRNLHPVHLAPGDRLLLVSDGVWGVLPEADLKALVRQDPQAAADALIQAVKALARPEQDNATAALLGLAEDGHERASAPGQPARAAPPATAARPARHKGPVIAALLALLLAALLGSYFGWKYLQPADPPQAEGQPKAGGTAADPASPPVAAAPSQPTEKPAAGAAEPRPGGTSARGAPRRVRCADRGPLGARDGRTDDQGPPARWFPLRTAHPTAAAR